MLSLIIGGLLLLAALGKILEDPRNLLWLILFIPLMILLGQQQSKWEQERKNEKVEQGKKMIPEGDTMVEVGEGELYSSTHPLIYGIGKYHLLVTNRHLVFSKDGVSSVLTLPIKGVRAEVATKKSVTATSLALFGVLGLADPFKTTEHLLLLAVHDPKSNEDYAIAFSKFTPGVARAIEVQRYAILTSESNESG